MPITISDLKVYGSTTMPDSDATTQIGGAIDTAKMVSFADVNGLVQVVSSAAGDTTQTVTVHYRDAAGVKQSEVKTLTGLTPVTYAATMERLLKAIKSATTTGVIAVEAQTAERSNTAQAGGANTITFDAGASAVDGAYNGMVCRLTGGTGSGQIGQVINYVGATKVATMAAAWTVTPDATTTFRIAKGFYFERAPVEVTQIRRPFYDAAADAPGGSAFDFFDLVYAKNTHGTLTLTDAKIRESADPTGKVTFGVGAAIDTTYDNGVGNNRKVAPAGVTFDSADKAVPGGALPAGSRLAVWLKLSLNAGDLAQNSTYTPSIQGSTV